MRRFENKRALITGSSSGIGAGIALAFAREGANVIINYPSHKQSDDAEEVADQVRTAGRKSEAIRAE
jgi:NAD(P)-dependent dehydrogenase (short-subunit alcohol dehydrogenase family)